MKRTALLVVAAFAAAAAVVVTAGATPTATPGVTGDDIRGITTRLDTAFANLRPPLTDCARAFELFASGQAATPRQVLEAFPLRQRRDVEMGLAWLAKLGALDWLD